MKQVGARLRLLRLTANQTQKQMGDLLGVQKEAWTKYEAGDLTPAPYKMEAICARFKVSMEYIYRGTLFGVHPGLAPLLAAQDPSLATRTSHILQGMGMDPTSSMESMPWLPTLPASRNGAS